MKKNYDQVLKNLGEVISEIRHDKKITQKQLAASAGISRATLADVEKGCRNVMVKNLLDVLVALDTPLEYILLRVAEERKAIPEDNGTLYSKIFHDIVASVLLNLK